jgi:hypothetical protein
LAFASGDDDGGHTQNGRQPAAQGTERLSENTFFDAFLENFVRKKSENFLKN